MSWFKLCIRIEYNQSYPCKYKNYPCACKFSTLEKLTHSRVISRYIQLDF
jgi:hypothetical protein